MFTLSAFADEIGPEPQQQIDVLQACNIRHIEFRSINGTNVLSLNDRQVDEFHTLLARQGMKLSAIGSPIGKARIDEPFEPQLEKLERAVKLARQFGTPNIRIFSFYPPEGATVDWSQHRREVLKRLIGLCRIADEAGVRLLHENEHRIYGDSPERVADLLTAMRGPPFEAVYDPANFVFCGYDPWEGWLKTRERVVHFHIKDWKAGETHGRVAGEGDGRIADVLRDAVSRGFDGFCSLEPHLLGGGPTGGVTGPELFPSAVAALRKIIRDVGGQERV
jgi:sugar phosphate isomerase/epimerase